MAMLSDYCRRIQELLLRYCDSLRVDSGGNLHDEAIAAENVFREILNATYGWNLTNANAANPLTAGYDLIDDEARILVQVSKDDSSEKMRHSFSALDAPSFQGYTFKFMMLVARHRRYAKQFDPPQGIHFDVQKDVLDISSLMNYLRNLPLETVREVHELVERHMESAVDVRSIPTCLGKVVRALIPKSFESCGGLGGATVFRIEAKIETNHLGAYRRRITEAAAYSHLITELYDAYASAGTYDGQAILASLADDYDRLVAREDDSLAVFDGLVDVLLGRLADDAAVSDIPYEMRLRCVNIVLADAFMRCRIFEGPDLTVEGGGHNDLDR